jgi:hypothetical protein
MRRRSVRPPRGTEPNAQFIPTPTVANPPLAPLVMAKQRREGTAT